MDNLSGSGDRLDKSLCSGGATAVSAGKGTHKQQAVFPEEDSRPELSLPVLIIGPCQVQE